MKNVMNGDAGDQDALESEAKPTSDSAKTMTPVKDPVQSGKNMMKGSAKVFAVCIPVTLFYMYKASLVTGTVSVYEPFPSPDYVSGSNPIILLVIVMTVAGYVFFRGFGRMLGWSVPNFLRETVTAIGVAIMFCFLGVVCATPVLDAKKELLELQHSWAEERYGITYDSIGDRSLGYKKGSVQHSFYSEALEKRVAEVCPESGNKILLCYPGTTGELPVIVQR